MNLIKERYVWIDYAKFFSIFLVVLYHTKPSLLLDSFIGNLLTLLRMPAFFLIAGYLFDIKKYNSLLIFLKHRSKQLLIPYFYFFIIFYFLWIIIGRNMVGSDELSINIYLPIKEFILGTPYIICAPYWFITCLFTIQVIYYLLSKLFNNKFIIFFISIILYIISNNIYIIDFWMISKALYFLPFYTFSNVFKVYINNIKYENNIFISLFLSAILVVYLLLNKNLNYIEYLILGFLILPIYIYCCKTIPKFNGTKLIELFSKNGIIILALQSYIIGFIKILSYKILGYNIFSIDIVINIFLSVIVILITYYPIIFINKYIPFIIGRKK